MKIKISLILFLLAAYMFNSCSDNPGSGDDSSVSISITEPAGGAELSGIITVRGDSSGLDSLTVTVDNDLASNTTIELSGFGEWETEIDTDLFMDGEHAVIAYNPGNPDIRDQVIVTTDNGNTGGVRVSVPVALLNGIYDEISEYKPLYVYLKSRHNGQVFGKVYTSGSLIINSENLYEIYNVPNGIYRAGAFLDRNNNLNCDVGTDFSGTATQDTEVSNQDCTTQTVMLGIYDGTDNEEQTSDEEMLNETATGSITIGNPDENAVLNGIIEVNGHVSSGVEHVAVEIDDNSFSRKITDVFTYMPRPYDWAAEFDSNSLRDGLHFIKAYVNSRIYAVRFFTSNNGVNGGYIISVPVSASDSFSGEISEYIPLYVYAKMPASGAKILSKNVTGDIPGNYSMENVPLGDYFIGAFLDKNNNGIIDTGDCVGVSETMYRVWYASGESAQVILHGRELNITVPDDTGGVIPDIPAGNGSVIHVEGTYRFQPELITVYMRKSPVTYSEVAVDALFSDPDPGTQLGSWTADLDISEVYCFSYRWLNAKSKYGVHYEYDNVLVNLLQSAEKEIHIVSPADGSHIFTNTLSMNGIYTDNPLSVSVYLDYPSDGTQQSVSLSGDDIAYANGEWNAEFSGLFTLNADEDRLKIRALADFGGGITYEDSVDVLIDCRVDTGIAIISPSDGDNVGTESVTVSGTYIGQPQAIIVTIETGSGNAVKSATGVSFDAGSWTAMIDLEGIAEGSRIIKAAADYGYWGVETDNSTVIVDSGIVLPEFTYRFEVLADPDAIAGSISYYIGWNDLPVHTYDVTLTSDPETTWHVSGIDDASKYWDGIHMQVGIYVNMNSPAETTINMYFNDNLEYTITVIDAGYLNIYGYTVWDESADTLSFFNGEWW